MMPARKYDYNESWQQIDYDEVLKTEEPKLLIRKKPKYCGSMFKVFLCMVIVVAVMVLLLQRYAVISETKYQIFDHKSRIKELQYQKEEMKAELDSAFVIEYVEKVAIEELNMQYPTASQVVYIGKESNYVVIKESSLPQEIEAEHIQLSYFDKIKLFPLKLTKVME